MSDHPIAEVTVGLYVSLLLGLGQIGLGWFLALRSPKMFGSFGTGKKSEPVFARSLVIWGWMLLICGCLGIAIFLALVVVITFQSFWP